MSELSKTSRDSYVSKEDFDFFLATKKINLKCPICEHELFNILFENNEIVAETPMVGQIDEMLTPPHGLKTVPILCAHCGFVLHFSLRMISLFLEEAARQSGDL